MMRDAVIDVAADLTIDQDRAGALGLVLQDFTGTTICSGCQRTIRTAHPVLTGYHPRRHQRWCRDCTAILTNVKPGLMFVHTSFLNPADNSPAVCRVTKVGLMNWSVYYATNSTPDGREKGDMHTDLGDFPRRVKALVPTDKQTKTRQRNILAGQLRGAANDLQQIVDSLPPMDTERLAGLVQDVKTLAERFAREAMDLEAWAGSK